jgi:secreted trypsin-like serine protease
MSSKKKAIISIFLLLAIIVGGFFVADFIINRSQSIDDSGALYGGELERGYPSAGYLISYSSDGNSKTCGYAALNNRVGVTASHCVDDSSQIFIGQGDFSLDTQRHTTITKATQKEGWINNKERANDFAILNFTDFRNAFTNIAEISSPFEGCNFRVVAYGRTENPDEIYTKPRKSAVMCASEIGSQTFMIQARDSAAGICFGDSGSPLYIDGTNQLVGVVVSIVLNDANKNEPCDFGNKAIVVRTDFNQSLINNNIQALGDATLPEVGVSDGLTIAVANETIWDKIGLGNLSQSQQLGVVLIGVIGVIILLFIILIVILLRPARPKESWS